MERMEKQTAVQWLEECIKIGLTYEQEVMFEGLFQQALYMEKEQMHKCASFWRGKENAIEKPIFEQYYNETYKSE